LSEDKYLKILIPILLLFSLLTLVANAIGESNTSVGVIGEFILLNQNDGCELRAFVAGPVDAEAGVLVVHDYFGISDATKQSVEHLGALGYRTIAVDLYGGKSATRHEEAVKLMQAVDQKAAGKILQAGLD
jgi:carboxymethylenebutenolidase